jgi:hypothetical protein
MVLRRLLSATRCWAAPSLVDHVDGLVGQLAVVDVAGRQFHRHLDRLGGVFDVVVVLEIGLQTLQDLDAVLHRRLVHVDLLEPAGERAVLFEVLAEFLVGGRAHAAQLAALQGGLQQVGRVHRAAGRGPGPDHRVDLVDEQHGIGVILKLGHHGLEPLFEIAAIAGSGEQGAHVERIDRGPGQHVGHLALDDLVGKTLGNRSLAHAGVTHQERVVLAAAAEHLNAAFHLIGTADQRVHVALLGFDVEVHAILGQRAVLFLGHGAGLCGLFVVRRSGDRTALAKGGVLGHAMGDEVHRVIAGHVLLLQEIGGIALALGKDRDEDVGPGHFGPARGLHMDRGALDHALERGGGHGFGAVDVGDEGRQIVLDEFFEAVAQLVQIDRTGPHHAGGVRFIDQGKQQMLQRGKLVTTRVCQGQGRMDGLLKGCRKRRHLMCSSDRGLGGRVPRQRWPLDVKDRCYRRRFKQKLWNLYQSVVR